MAITPFTKPVKQGKILPQKPKLPVKSLAKSASKINQQDIKQRDRLSKIKTKLAKQKASSYDQKNLHQMEKRYRDRLNKIADDELLFGDRQVISDVARDFASEAQTLQQNKKNIEETLKAINNLENPSEARKQEMKETYLKNAGLETTEEGRLDSESLHSPVSVGEEPESIYKKARKKVQELPEDFLGEKVTRDPKTGKLKITEASGVGERRIANLLMGRRVGDKEGISDLVGEDGKYTGALTEDPEVQNWMKQKRETLTAKGYSEENANKAIDTKLKNAVASMVDNFSYTDPEINREERADGSGMSSEDYSPAITTPMSLKPYEETSGAERKELKSQWKYAQKMALDDMFKKSNGEGYIGDLTESDIEDIRNTIHSPSNRRAYSSGLLSPDVKEPKRDAVIRNIKKEHGPDVAQRVEEEYDDTVERMSNKSSLGRERMVYPRDDVSLSEVTTAAQGIEEGFIRSADIVRAADDPIGNFVTSLSGGWVGDSTKEHKKQYKNEAVSYGKVVGMTKDGMIRVRMPDNKSVSSEIQGEIIDMNIDDDARSSVMNAYADVVGETDPYTAEAIRKELQYDDTVVKTKEEGWDNLENMEGAARYNPETKAFEIATGENNNPATFNDIISAEGEVNNKLISGILPKVSKLQQSGVNLSELDSYSELRSALKADTKGGEFKNEEQRRQLERLANKPFQFDHKGISLDYLKKFNNK